MDDLGSDPHKQSWSHGYHQGLQVSSSHSLWQWLVHDSFGLFLIRLHLCGWLVGHRSLSCESSWNLRHRWYSRGERSNLVNCEFILELLMDFTSMEVTSWLSLLSAQSTRWAMRRGSRSETTLAIIWKCCVFLWTQLVISTSTWMHPIAKQDWNMEVKQKRARLSTLQAHVRSYNIRL